MKYVNQGLVASITLIIVMAFVFGFVAYKLGEFASYLNH